MDRVGPAITSLSLVMDRVGPAITSLSLVMDRRGSAITAILLVMDKYHFITKPRAKTRGFIIFFLDFYFTSTRSCHGVAVCSITLFKSLMFFLPSVRNHSLAASSPSLANGSTTPLHVARPQRTPLNFEPASLANSKV